MIFPFITNQVGFDTGFALSNPAPGGGTCTLIFLGDGAPVPNFINLSVLAGKSTSGLVSAFAAGFQGQMVAACTFPGGQGFAFLSNNTTLSNAIADGFLPVVINNNGIPINSSF
jgi:hypothetical protein